MKKIRHSFFVIVFLCAVHALLCVAYNYTYFSTEFNFQERFQGILVWVVLMAAFLAGPFFYYVAGRLCKGKGSKKLILISLLVMNVAVSILGIVSFFSPSLLETYRLINAPSYLYYSLFADGVIYLAIPAMIASSLFPVFFFKIGYVNKPRTNNEIKMDELEIKEEKEL